MFLNCSGLRLTWVAAQIVAQDCVYVDSVRFVVIITLANDIILLKYIDLLGGNRGY